MKILDRLFDYELMFTSGQMKLPSAEIIQIAELSLIRNGEITNHIQNCDEITYAVSGKATIFSGNSSFKMTAGQIHYIKQGEPHRIVADPDEHFHYYCIGFIPNQNYDTIQLFLNAIHDLRDFVVKDEGNFHRTFNLLMNEFYIRDTECNSMIHLYFCQMLILLYRSLIGNSGDTLNKFSSSTSSHAVYQALKYIDKNFIKLTNVKDISKELSYSEYYLSHIFKEKMHMTIKDYLLQKKIMTASELLKNSNMSISEIAEQLHFSSINVFGSAFKRYMHMSASDFRKKNGSPQKKSLT